MAMFTHAMKSILILITVLTALSGPGCPAYSRPGHEPGTQQGNPAFDRYAAVSNEYLPGHTLRVQNMMVQAYLKCLPEWSSQKDILHAFSNRQYLAGIPVFAGFANSSRLQHICKLQL
jgi:hypothetical protein